MSQRREKYARAMERRVARLEELVERLNVDMATREIRTTTAKELLEVMAVPSYVIKTAQDRDGLDAPAGVVLPDHSIPMPPFGSRSASHAEDRRAARREARRKRTARRRVAAMCMALLAIILLLVAVSRGMEPDQEEAENVATTLSAPVELAAPATDLWVRESENTLGAEKSAVTPLDDVPLPHDLQDVMRIACAVYGCPPSLALAVAETESQFDIDAVGAVGEVGIMQLNPGPGGSYHATLEAAIGQAPTTPAGNIACGVYLLGKYMDEYADPAKAAMAYSMGEAGAIKAWAEGVTATDYSNAVLEAMERWEEIVNPWACE